MIPRHLPKTMRETVEISFNRNGDVCGTSVVVWKKCDETDHDTHEAETKSQEESTKEINSTLLLLVCLVDTRT